MAWTAPKTFASNSIMTAADLNTYLRDNSLETVPAKAQTPGSIFVATGLNAIAERVPNSALVSVSETTTSTTYTNLTTTGPTVTVTTSVQALVFIYAEIFADAAASRAFMSYAISGATTNAADDATSVDLVGSRGQRVSACILHAGLTPGSNTFTMKYKLGNGVNASFNVRRLAVLPL